MRLENGDRWHFRADVGYQSNFAVWLLMRDGLRVPPFDRHPDGDHAIRLAGLNAARWWTLAIGEWEGRFLRPLEQQLEELRADYRAVFGARRIGLMPPPDPGLWRSLAPYRAVLEPIRSRDRGLPVAGGTCTLGHQGTGRRDRAGPWPLASASP